MEDTPFWYDRINDGRTAADENMLKSLTALSLQDCVNISDRAIEGLARRCRAIETLNLHGCEKLTSASLRFMADPDPYKIPLCDSLKTLNLSACSGIRADDVVELTKACGVLEDLNLSCVAGVDDAFCHRLCLACPTLLKINLCG